MMATRETTRFHIPYPGADDAGSWDAKFVTMLAQIDALIFANLENLKPVFEALPVVTNDVAAVELQQTGDLVFVSRTLNVQITVASGATLSLLPDTMIGVRLTAGAVGAQTSVWETAATADIDAEFQVLGYVDSGLTIRWFTGAVLAPGETAELFQDPVAGIAREDADLVIGGGGGIGLAADTLTWTEAITVRSPRSGGIITIAAGAVGVLAGEFLYVEPSTRPIPTEAGTLLAGATVPGGAIAVGARIGAIALLRNDHRKTFALTAANGKDVTTGSAGAGGGTVAGSVFVNVARGLAHRLRVKANGNTVLTDVVFYADAAHTEQVFAALAQDCFTGGAPPYFDRRVAWPLTGWAADLASGLLYYEFTNNGANASTYRIEITGEGEL